MDKFDPGGNYVGVAGFIIPIVYVIARAYYPPMARGQMDMGINGANIVLEENIHYQSAWYVWFASLSLACVNIFFIYFYMFYSIRFAAYYEAHHSSKKSKSERITDYQHQVAGHTKEGTAHAILLKLYV